MSTLLLGVKNTTTQTVPTGGTINLGSVYRKYCKKCNGVNTFAFNGNSIGLQQQGFYKITANFVGSGTAAGDVTVQLVQNGVVVPAALSTETITTANTEIRTFSIDYFVLVGSETILGCTSTQTENITFINTGVEGTFTSLVVDVEKPN